MVVWLPLLPEQGDQHACTVHYPALCTAVTFPYMLLQPGTDLLIRSSSPIQYFEIPNICACTGHVGLMGSPVILITNVLR
jgi:hypothetical protein